MSAWSGTEWVELRGISSIELTVKATDFDELKLVIHPFSAEFMVPPEHVRIGEYKSVNDEPPPLIDKSDMQHDFDARLAIIELNYHASLASILQAQADGVEASEIVERIRFIGTIRDRERQELLDA